MPAQRPGQTPADGPLSGTTRAVNRDHRHIAAGSGCRRYHLERSLSIISGHFEFKRMQERAPTIKIFIFPDTRQLIFFRRIGITHHSLS
jgi:hypothetical protein